MSYNVLPNFPTLRAINIEELDEFFTIARNATIVVGHLALQGNRTAHLLHWDMMRLNCDLSGLLLHMRLVELHCERLTRRPEFLSPYA